jgi:DNA polymerase-3 subunit epsilon
MIAPEEAERLVNEIVVTGRYRVLRRLDLDEWRPTSSAAVETSVGVVIDVETTGLDRSRCKIIELSLRRFRHDAHGRITKLDSERSWLEDPGEPLDPKISALTGLSDDDLHGRSIDERTACAVIASASVRIAFNAAFDRPVVERRLPAIAGLPWACAMKEVDWRRRGFDGSGRALGWLLAQAGWFHGAHRAGADVDATVALLDHRSADGVSALAELLATASRPGWLFRALGADFSVKGALRARGYRWDADDKVWWREVPDAERDAEQAWLDANVYAPEHMPRAYGPIVREVTWETRHG